MSRTEAIEAMKKGLTIRHRWFSDDEWMRMDGDKYLFEDNVRASPEEFWKWRTDISWLYDWSLVKEVSNA